MEIRVKKYYFHFYELLKLFNYYFIIYAYTYLTHIAVSNTVTRDVTNCYA